MITRAYFESFTANAASLFGYRGNSYFAHERSRILA
jgi:hypothetical protein